MKSQSSIMKQCGLCICMQTNPKQNENSIEVDGQFKLPLKKIKTSLRRSQQATNRTQRTFNFAKKKNWEEQTRTGTDRQTISKAWNLNQRSSSIYHPNTDRMTEEKNFMQPQLSSRTFEVTSQHNPIILKNYIYVIEQERHPRNYPVRNSIGNIRSHPTFLIKNESLQSGKLIKPFSRPDIRYIEQQRTPEAQRTFKHPTINSLQDSLINERISESTIQIDFFNPSEKRLFHLENSQSHQSLRFSTEE